MARRDKSGELAVKITNHIAKVEWITLSPSVKDDEFLEFMTELRSIVREIYPEPIPRDKNSSIEL
jgi:hypothetical protein